MSTKPKNTAVKSDSSDAAAIVNELQVRLDERERQLEDALARLDDALKQTDFVSHGEDPLLNLTEAGELVGRSHQTIRNMINQKMLRCVQEPGGLIRVRQSSLVKLFAEAFLIDEEQRQRDIERAERRRQDEAERRANSDQHLRIDRPPEGGDTYVNPILLQLKRERERSQS